jgi:membrane-bound lytic murein transglycosylase D
MRHLLLCVAAAALAFFVGCSTQESTSARKAAPAQQTLQPSAPPRPPAEALTDTVASTNADVPASLPDSIVSAMLEKARQHYISATTAQQSGDSVRSALQFEQAISILDELSYLPGIEEKGDFNDLSKAVIEDYEQYIARIDSLDPRSSVFALRAKLNQFTESIDTLEAGRSTPVYEGTTIPLVVNNLVEQNISFFQGRGRPHMERWLEVSGKYFPLMKQILREEGVPEEIVHLSMVESGINPVARSWARAVGMWQFVKGTGRLYGLTANYWYDERRDFEKATHAMARHMKDLHDEFGDWYLALAAYNSGAGRVYRGIRRSGSTDFWEMRRKLPRETRNYVPQFIAVTLIYMNPEEYGFAGIKPAPPLTYDFATVNDCVSLDVLASCAGADIWTMRELNPELVRWCTPPGMKEYSIRVPRGSVERFKSQYAAIPDDQKRDWIVHMVRKGETLGGIAQKYGIPAEVIQEHNQMASARKLSVGKPLVIPVPRGSSRYASLVEASARIDVESRGRSYRSTRVPPDRTKVQRALASSHKRVPVDSKEFARLSYTVKKGDTVGHIAEWYSCRAADIRNWNDIAYGEPIRVGSELAIWVRKGNVAKYEKIDDLAAADKQALMAARAVPTRPDDAPDANGKYLVKPGDTLEKIAQENGVSIRQLQRWNRIKGSRIAAGQELTIHSDAKAVRIDQSGSTSVGTHMSADGKTIVYVVKKGDTLWDIAKAHGVAPSDLRAWNDLERNSIYAGQELRIHVN